MHAAVESRVSFQSRQSDQREVKSWLELVAEVEELFGPMPAFANHLQRGIEHWDSPGGR